MACPRTAFNVSVFSLCTLFAAVAACWADDKNPATKRPLTVADSLEMRRVLRGTFEPGPIRYSPDGSRYLIALVRDDLERGGTWLELISGRTDALESAVRPEPVARLFTTSAADYVTGRESPIHPVYGLSGLQWLDEERVVFQWTDGASPSQVTMLDLGTGQMRTLTQHSTSIQSYAISGDGARILYKAYPNLGEEHRERMDAMLREGFAVSGLFLPDILTGYYDGAHPFRSQEIYVSRTADQRPRKVRCAAIQCDYLEELGAPQRFSPDGRYAVVQLRPAVNTAEEIPTEWKRYTDFSMRHAIHSGGRRVSAGLFVRSRHSVRSRPIRNVVELDPLSTRTAPCLRRRTSARARRSFAR